MATRHNLSGLTLEGRMAESIEDDLETLKRILAGYCNANAYEGRDMLREEIHHSPAPKYAAPFRRGLAHALAHRLIGSHELEYLTGFGFESDDKAQAWLQELWKELFSDSRPSETDPRTALGSQEMRRG